MKPSREGDLVYVVHMLECIERVLEFCEGEEASFRQSRLIQDAVRLSWGGY